MALYCYKDPDGELLAFTLSDDKEDLVFALFHHLPAEVQAKYWKRVGPTKAWLTRQGYKAVKVKLVEVKWLVEVK